MKNIVLRLVALLSLTFLSISQDRMEKVPKVVDLTLPAPPQASITTGRGVPGSSNLSPVTLLPVTLNIESIEHAIVSGKIVVVLVTVQNLSEKDFELPIGRDVQAITADSRRGRKTFAFRLRALCDKCDRKQLRTVALTASSASLPETRIILKPGEQAYVKLFVDTGFYPLVPAERVVDLQLGCQETELEDGRYFIKNSSTIAWLDLRVPRP